jgi:linoleoyl-CoA desaturase
MVYGAGMDAELELPQDGPLLREGTYLATVRSRVSEALAHKALRGDPRLQWKAVLIFAWFFGSFAGMLAATQPWLQVLLCVSYGVAASAVGFNIFHDANHNAFSSRKRTNLAMGMLTSVVLGASRYFWNFKHQVLHHRFTNIHTLDDDLETRGFLRLSPHQEWKKRYRGQHLFVFVLYAINAIELVFVKDFVQYATLRINPHWAIPPMSRGQKWEFWISKILYFSIFIGIPLAILPPATVLVGFLIYEFTVGILLALIFSLAHQVETVEFPAPCEPRPTTSDEWAIQQMRTTANFATANPAWHWYTGGLNHQIEHHLFPSISHTHYGEIRQIVQDTAGEFGVPYNSFKTYGDALGSHYRHLRTLSAKARPDPAGILSAI